MLFNTLVLGYSPQHIMMHTVSALFHLTAHCRHTNAIMLKKSLSDEMRFSHMADASLINVLKSDLTKLMGEIVPPLLEGV